MSSMEDETGIKVIYIHSFYSFIMEFRNSVYIVNDYLSVGFVYCIKCIYNALCVKQRTSNNAALLLKRCNIILCYILLDYNVKLTETAHFCILCEMEIFVYLNLLCNFRCMPTCTRCLHIHAHIRGLSVLCKDLVCSRVDRLVPEQLKLSGLKFYRPSVWYCFTVK